MKLLLFPLLICVLAACDFSPPPDNRADTRFHTTDPSHLYFRNLRASAYRTRTLPGRMEEYRYGEFPDSSSQPILLPVIVDNWLADEAYIYLRPLPGSDLDPSRPLTLYFDDGDSLRLAGDSPEAHLDFAKAWFQRLQQNESGKIVTNDGKRTPVNATLQTDKWAKQILSDYLTLTEQQ